MYALLKAEGDQYWLGCERFRTVSEAVSEAVSIRAGHSELRVWVMDIVAAEWPFGNTR